MNTIMLYEYYYVAQNNSQKTHHSAEKNKPTMRPVKSDSQQ